MAKTKDFSSQQFWENRFESELHFEWLAAADVLVKHIVAALSILCSSDDGANLNLLHIGSGTSELSNKLRKKLVPSLIPRSKQIVNLDYSKLAIQRGRDMELSTFGSVEMTWAVADLLHWDSFKQALETDSHALEFRIIVEKSCADAISCGENVDVLNPSTQEVESVGPTVALALNLAKVTTSGSFWIALSYSKFRFDFLDSAAATNEFSATASLPQKAMLSMSPKCFTPYFWLREYNWSPIVDYFIIIPEYNLCRGA
ncbi:hypothetical protein BDR26DRAFT_799023 [Obelidium mucronatum]|nr:hypothetical protein BDR26DRAFT_799023 [Obelidium mucronatum]